MEKTVYTTVTSLTTDSRHSLLVIRNFLAGFLGVASTDCSLAKCQRDRVYDIRDVAKQTVDSCKHVQAVRIQTINQSINNSSARRQTWSHVVRRRNANSSE